MERAILSIDCSHDVTRHWFYTLHPQSIILIVIWSCSTFERLNFLNFRVSTHTCNHSDHQNELRETMICFSKSWLGELLANNFSTFIPRHDALWCNCRKFLGISDCLLFSMLMICVLHIMQVLITFLEFFFHFHFLSSSIFDNLRKIYWKYWDRLIFCFLNSQTLLRGNSKLNSSSISSSLWESA